MCLVNFRFLIFTTTLRVRSCCFVTVFPNEQTSNFLQVTIEALNIYGGVPKILKPDNTMAASITKIDI